MTIDLDKVTFDDILARTIVGEARGEGPEGMKAVACTVMNRLAKNTWYGHTVKEICLKPYQYSCWLLGDPNRTIILNLDDSYSIYREALDIAQQVMSKTVPDNTNGATHYKVVGTHASWAQGKSPCKIIGRHEFYNDIA